MTLRSRQRGYLLVTMILMMFLVAAVAALLALDSSFSANTANRELESARADYVAQAGMQHALWRVQNNSCMGEFTIPATALGGDTYTATVSGAAPADMLVLPADQDAWIRSDDTTRNNGGSAANHVRFESPNVEQVLTRFDVSSIAPNAQINSAIAWFHLKAGKTHPEGPITVHEITADWGEATVTWESFAAAYRSGAIAAIPAQEAGDVWVAINLTAQVQSWVNGQANHGILFTSTAEGLRTEYTAREDGANPPRLEVVVGSGAASPVQIVVAGTLDSGVTRTLAMTGARAWQPTSRRMLQPDASDVEDAWTTSFKPDWNYGIHQTLQVQPDNKRSFLQADLRGHVPVGAMVTQATLELYASSVSTPGAVDLHRVSRPWEEGTCSGGCPPDDGVTWDTYNGVNTWHSAGGDIDVVPVTSATTASSNSWVEWDITALVSAWANDPSSNYGVMLDGKPGSATFVSSDGTDPTQRPRLTIEYACECGTPCIAPQGAGRIALIGDDNSPDPDDQLKIEVFESWGYDVDFYEDLISDTVDWSSYDMVYVSETAIASDVQASLTNLSIGIVNEEPNLYDDLELASGNAENVGASIDITDNSHFITAIFQQGPLSIYTGGMELLTATSPLAGGLQTLGEFSGEAALTATDKGAQTTSGTAAGRRVTLPLGQHFAAGFDWRNLDYNGHLLVQRSIAWAMGAEGAAVSSKIVLSAETSATLGGLTFTGSDLAEYDPGSDGATLFLDGSLAGMSDLIDAVHVLENGNIILSTTADTSFAGLSFAKEDLIEYDPIADSATMYLEAAVHFSDRENVISVHVFDNQNIVLSTDSGATLGGLSFSDKDLVEYDRSTGSASIFFDGDATTLSQEIRALHILDNGNLVIAPDADTTLGGLTFGADQLVEYDPVSDTANLYFDGEALFSSTTERIWSLHIGPGSGGPSGPIAHWKLDDGTGLTAIDSEGGHDGTLANGPVWAAGHLGDAVSFDGSNDRINVSHDAGLDLVSQMTLTAWIYSDDLNGFHLVLTKGDNGVPENYWLGTDGDGVNFGFVDGSTDAQFTSSVLSLQTGRWHHVAATFDNAADEVKLYLDGNVETFSSTYSPAANGETLIIGNSYYSGEGFEGQIDDVRIYDHVLGDAEIAELAGSTGPLAHWMLDDGTGTTAVDSAGGHDGTLTNGPVWVAGQLGDALRFDGNNDYVDLTSDDEIDDVFDGGATVMAWIYPTGWGENGYGRIFDKSSSASSTGDGWALRMNVDNGGIFNFGQGFSGGRGWWRVPNGSIQLNAWQHVAIVYDASSPANEPEMYVDGVPLTVILVDSPSGSLRSDESINLRLGNFAGGTSHTFAGTIDDARIYSRMLLPGEVAAIAASGGGGGGGGSGCDGTFRDEFDSPVYSNSDGSLPWATDWQETGESTNPTGGDIRIDDDVSNYQLQLRDDGQSVMREADLSEAGSATLSFSYRRQNLSGSSHYVAVEVSYDGGSNWGELARFTGTATDSNYQPFSMPLDSNSLSANTRIRFLTPSSGMNNNNMVWFDDVQIACAP